jgi:hypothetical protein
LIANGGISGGADHTAKHIGEATFSIDTQHIHAVLLKEFKTILGCGKKSKCAQYREPTLPTEV